MTVSHGEGSHRQVLIALRRIIRAYDVHSRALIQRFGLTGPQLIILQELSRLGEVPAGELAKAINLSQPTVTGILKRLESKGLVQRRRDADDRRVVLIKITPACSALLQAAPPALRESFTRAFDQLGDWEQNLIISSLQRVVAMMEATNLDGTAMMASHAIESMDLDARGPAQPSSDRVAETTPPAA